MTAAPLTSFTQVPGWREAFDEAHKRLVETRTGSLFPEIADELCGERVRAFSLRDWTIMEQARSPLVCGGPSSIDHAVNVLWLLRTGLVARLSGNGRIARAYRAAMLNRVLRRHRYDELAVVAQVAAFIDDALLDMPGRGSAPQGLNPTAVPRVALDIALCAEVMHAFPSFRFTELHAMPLAQFWQWLHRARKKEDPEYRNDQITDEVNRQALGEKRRINAALAQAA